jgi:uncharacterized protein
MIPRLTQGQRLLTACIYLVILFVIFHFVGGGIQELVSNNKLDSSIWFYVGALMIILGSYIVEPFFTKPSDAVVNSITIIIALWGLSSTNSLVGYRFVQFYTVFILIMSIIAIISKELKNDFIRKISRTSYWIAINGGNAKVIFSLVYILAAYSFYAKPHLLAKYNILFSFWVCLVFFDIVGLGIEKATKIIDIFHNKFGEELGQAIGCENPLLYKVEIDYLKHKPCDIKYGDIIAIETSLNIGSIGMVINSKQLLHKKWLSIYLLQDQDKEILRIDLKSKKLATESKSIFQKDNLVFLIDQHILEQDIQDKINNNQLFKYKDVFVGYVSSGSNINTINFTIIKDLENSKHKINEGAILKTNIYNFETLYQVINGNTKEEHLENFDTHGYIVGIARKLGKYNYEKKELNVCKWMPLIYSPLFFAFNKEISPERIKEIAVNSIGRLPDTDLEIPIKDFDALVTHNTAILGILGIGKSCLSYELIKKLTDKNVKIICIDITNEYRKELPAYLSGAGVMEFDNETAFNEINNKYEYIHTDGCRQNYEKSGNVAEYRISLRKSLCNFLFNTDNVPETKIFSGNCKVRIYNLDYHKVSRGEKIGFSVITTDLTQAEKTRILSEELFRILMHIPLTDEKIAKVLLVFEEAHSLIPEWNSVANEGDKNASNGTAKIILQGRKYGLGSLIVTQRTANVSKSVLNQCNTIFAMRVFDDTGKGFLENYIGEDYSNTLPTLDERNAIVIGKGMKLKQPVIIQLNDKQNIISTV